MSDAILATIITACATTIPQIIIAFINYRKDLKLKKMQVFDEQRINVIFEYLECVGNCSSDGITLRDKSNYQIALNKLLLYFPDINEDIMDNIFKSLFNHNIKNKYEALLPLIKQLSKSIQSK